MSHHYRVRLGPRRRLLATILIIFSAALASWLLPGVLPPLTPALAGLGLSVLALQLSVAELATLWGPPTPETARLMETVAARWLPAPARAFIPADDPRYLHLGDGQKSDGSWAPIGLRYDMLRYVFWMTAQMGRGKSVWLKNLFRGLLRAGAGCMLVDMKGFDLVNAAIQLIPRDREQDVVILDAGGYKVNGDDLRPAMNLLSGDFGRALGVDYDTQASTMMSFFGALDDRFDGAPAVQNFATMGMLALMEGEPNATMQHLIRFYDDEDYRAEVVERITNAQVKDFWLSRFPQMSSQDTSPLTAFKRRIDLLLTYPSIAAMSVAPGCSINLRELMDNRGILLAGISAKDGKIAHLIATLLLTQMTLAALSRTNVSDREDAEGFCPERPDFAVVLDEAQIVFEKNPGMAPIIFSQLRAMRIGTMVVHQNIQQIKSILSVLGGNSQSRGILGAKEEDAKAYESDYGALGLRAEDIINMEKFYHQYIGLYDTDVPIFSARMLPPPPKLVEPAPPRCYDNFRTVRAPARSRDDERLDDQIAWFKELAVFDQHQAVQRLGELYLRDPNAYAAYCARTRAHRLAQRQFILENPGCIRDKATRIRTLSALKVGVPLIETKALQWALLKQAADAADARAAAAEAEKTSKGKGKGAKAPKQVAPMEGMVASGSHNVPDRAVAGAAGAAVLAGSSAGTATTRLPTLEELLAARGVRRLGEDEEAPGFEELEALEMGRAS